MTSQHVLRIMPFILLSRENPYHIRHIHSPFFIISVLYLITLMFLFAQVTTRLLVLHSHTVLAEECLSLEVFGTKKSVHFSSLFHNDFNSFCLI
uniref:Uncharacterized protein n=1 Tax=Anguilla anguilla TaxID=7936 RepID=A0A0E9TXU0_ANGAN